MKPNLEKEKMFYNLINSKIFIDSKKGIVKVLGKYNKNRIYSSNDINKYIYVSYFDNKKLYIITMHRLIWIYEKGLLLDPKLQINHKDGVKGHCWIDNLELSDNSKNMKHAYLLKLKNVSDKARNLSSIRISGEKNMNSKFLNKEVKFLRKEFLNKNLSIDDIYKMYNGFITKRSIKNMLNEKTYKYGSVA